MRVGAVSVGGGRHVHARSIPRLGGVAIFAAFFAPLTAFLFLESAIAAAFRSERQRATGLFVGGLITCALGVWDDTRGARAWHKLVVELLEMKPPAASAAPTAL